MQIGIIQSSMQVRADDHAPQNVSKNGPFELSSCERSFHSRSLAYLPSLLPAALPAGIYALTHLIPFPPPHQKQSQLHHSVTLIMNAAPSETILPWAPNMVYRARRHRNLPQTLCEKFIEQQVFTFFRAYLPMGGPNYNYGPVMERATRFVLHIVSQRE